MAMNDAIIIDRCKLSAILRDKGVEGFAGTRTEEWICLVSHSSRFNTSALNVGPRATNHGIFLLSAKWWCNDSKTPHTHNNCNLSCDALRDDNITDDIHCAKSVVQRNKGFKAWRAWEKYCKGQELKKYITGCDLEEVTPMTLAPATKGLTSLAKGPPEPTTTPLKKEHPKATLLPKSPPKPTFSINEPKRSTHPPKGPPKPTVPIKGPTRSTHPPKGPPKPTVSIKELTSSTLPSKGPPKPTVSIKEPSSSTLPENGLPKSTLSLKKAPNSILPADRPPKPTLSVKESSNATLPGGGHPTLTSLIEEVE
ncbi:YLP motif-containing protein 1-like isoform X2 [Rhineura floridana]|uniref:YLP motif-containing protein 1-like isoform X1 n=1 Tax=Rhineura floridana TaxID=261503 RepID=UPI002AC7EC0F|nr:YLP motif-containing protein 1-like isoform X1 [Rhineura floridana]XP_061470345.1 YLP motif-containing protein 1-like isoform X2 [Rhineura floridana]